MRIKAKTIFAGGTAYNLTPLDDLYIGRKTQIFASLSVANQAAISYADSQAPVVTVLGEVYSGYWGLAMTSTAVAGTAGNLARVTLGKTGRIAAGDDAIHASSMALRLVNDGIIRSGSEGVEVLNHEGTSLIVNRGQILADNHAISIGATLEGGLVSLVNSGLILGGSLAVFDTSAPSVLIRWAIQNSGTIFGALLLNNGDDLVDSARGQIFGIVNLNGGADRYLPGAGTEQVFGGLGIDTLDFSTGKAVTLDLFNPAANAGRAAGDAYTDFEIFIGSQRGGDRLLDERVELHNGDFRGLGGNDVISTGFGDDTITGGLGRDTLSGGMGADKFVFGSAREGGDTITDFVAGIDQIRISGAGFAIPVALRNSSQGLDEELFHVGPRAAERDDRFILKTADARFDTLWFDPDGSGRRPAVLLAVLPENVGLAEGHIFVF